MVRIWNIDEVSQIKDELIEIWQEAFGDSEEVIHTFMQKVHSDTKVVTYEVADRIVSAAYLVPISYIKDKNTTVDCYYLYAAATETDYRGRGCFAHILRFLNERIDEPIILVPATESLVEYYIGHGFGVWLVENQDAIAKFENTKAKPITKEEYCSFRKEVFGRPHSMLWDEEMMDYICSEHEKAGGIFAETYIDDARVLFMCMGAGKDWNIAEIVSHNESLCVWPTVMANKALFEEGNGYFNLTMG